MTSPIDPERELFNYIAEKYPVVKRLEDGSIAAIGSLMFTTALYMGMNHTGYCKRYCFEEFGQALREFAKLKTEDDEPTGHIASRTR